MPIPPASPLLGMLRLLLRYSAPGVFVFMPVHRPVRVRGASVLAGCCAGSNVVLLCDACAEFNFHLLSKLRREPSFALRGGGTHLPLCEAFDLLREKGKLAHAKHDPQVAPVARSLPAT